MDTATYKVEVASAFNEAAARYDRLGVEFFTPMGRRLVEHARPEQGESVLDIGCGVGASVFPAADRVGPRGNVLGIDIASGMVAQTMEHARAQSRDNVTALVMDAERPDLPERSFDVVMGGYSVIFLPDAPAALGRYVPLMADGGRLAFSTPVFDSGTFPFLPPVFTDLIPRSLLSDLPPEWRPERLQQRFNSWLEDPADLVRAVETAGYSDVRVVDEPVDMVARSGEAWVDWSHTQGMRLLWEHLTEDRSRELRSTLITALDAMRSGDGPLTIEVPVRYVTARVSR
ncbi:O-methyltransferase/aklanonic acid methyltransferase [Nocardiopsis arvandica]|uniref:O-methyltransferase/aklanonic acid methyltransferase n=1 Tax=Nocardiopsis sinuspersici TaxID=501010 RepID=A0A7Y9XJF2_9ACTN|nr:O-methyltransferase/aklanonic acid methyltransferase [Nocardiopsis sinuspersici]